MAGFIRSHFPEDKDHSLICTTNIIEDCVFTLVSSVLLLVTFALTKNLHNAINGQQINEECEGENSRKVFNSYHSKSVITQDCGGIVITFLSLIRSLRFKIWV